MAPTTNGSSNSGSGVVAEEQRAEEERDPATATAAATTTTMATPLLEERRRGTVMDGNAGLGGDGGDDDNNDDDNDHDHPRSRRLLSPHRVRSFRRLISLMSSPLTGEEGPGTVTAGVTTLAVLGCVLGLALPKSDSFPASPWYRIFSSCVGYTYFLDWSKKRVERSSPRSLFRSFLGIAGILLLPRFLILRFPRFFCNAQA